MVSLTLVWVWCQKSWLQFSPPSGHPARCSNTLQVTGGERRHHVFHLPWHLRLSYPRLRMPFQSADRACPEGRGNLAGSTQSCLKTSKTLFARKEMNTFYTGKSLSSGAQTDSSLEPLLPAPRCPRSYLGANPGSAAAEGGICGREGRFWSSSGEN